MSEDLKPGYDQEVPINWAIRTLAIYTPYIRRWLSSICTTYFRRWL